MADDVGRLWVGVGAPFGNRLLKPSHDLHHDLKLRIAARRNVGIGVEGGSLPFEKGVEFLGGQSDDLEENHAGEAHRNIGHEVAMSLGADLVEEFNHPLGDPCLQVWHALHREVAGQHLAPLGMFGRIELDRLH